MTIQKKNKGKVFHKKEKHTFKSKLKLKKSNTSKCKSTPIKNWTNKSRIEFEDEYLYNTLHKNIFE